MIKSNIVVASGKIKKEDTEVSPAEKTGMDKFKLHIGCIDPLSKAIQSMKACYEDLADEDLKAMLLKCIEDTGRIEEVLLQKAGEALKSEIVSIRSKPETDIGSLAEQIAGKIPLVQQETATEAANPAPPTT